MLKSLGTTTSRGWVNVQISVRALGIRKPGDGIMLHHQARGLIHMTVTWETQTNGSESDPRVRVPAMRTVHLKPKLVVFW